jgi:hypothetical protein
VPPLTSGTRLPIPAIPATQPFIHLCLGHK